MKRITLSVLLLACSYFSAAQENNTTEQEKKTTIQQFKDNLSGSFESNIQWYNDDKKLGDFAEKGKDLFGEEHLRANTYLKLDYSFLKNFKIGIQVESYAPKSLLNYAPEYDNTNIAQYYANYINNKGNLDITGGFFYEQFGSGLLLRSFEERQLGINTSLRGGRIKFSPVRFINLTALYGQQRIGLDKFPEQRVTRGRVYGFDTEINLASALGLKLNRFSIGGSYVGKYESLDNAPDGFPEMINSYAFRTDIDFGSVYLNAEYNLKGEEIGVLPEGSPGGTGGQPIPGKYFTGNGLIVTTGYSKKGFGISNTFRRLENMTFFSERQYYNSAKNTFNLASMNYLPALTKQQDYSLANIYVYNTQAGLDFFRGGARAGEIGTQLDAFYKFKKESLLGKYKTKVSANFSYWALLQSEFDYTNYSYSSEFLNFRQKVYRDFNFEVRNKWSSKLSTIFTFVNNEINKNIPLGGPVNAETGKRIKSNIAIIEGTYKLKNRKSVRLELQHLWTKEDDKNWAGGTFEFNASKRLSFYATDMWNYGGGFEDNPTPSVPKAEHYYNFGGSYTAGATRIGLNYGRQRGGLFCVGGVCRQVSPNTGLTINIATSF